MSQKCGISVLFYCILFAAVFFVLAACGGFVAAFGFAAGGLSVVSLKFACVCGDCLVTYLAKCFCDSGGIGLGLVEFYLDLITGSCGLDGADTFLIAEICLDFSLAVDA